MTGKTERDVEKSYPLAEFVAKLRRFADTLEAGERFDIQIDGERIRVPKDAAFTIEHERGDGEEEIEFQVRWALAAAEGDDEEDGDESEETHAASEKVA